MSQRTSAHPSTSSISAAATAFVVLAAFALPAAAHAAADKTEICHFNADNDPNTPDWELLSVNSGKTVEKHLAHGDGLPGGEVPDSNGQAVFDSQCAVVVIDFDGDGVLNEDDNCPNTANPDQLDRYGSPKGDACEDDYNDNGIVDVDEAEVCVSIDGYVVLWNGTMGMGDPPCTSSPSTGDYSNVAITTGIYTYASAIDGNGNIAIADIGNNGFGAMATALGGDFNYAYAYGHALAQAGPGNHNTAIAINDGSIIGGCPVTAAEPDGVTITECEPL